MYLENYERWKNHQHLDKDLKKALLSLNEQEIKENFYKSLSFGTGGLRAKLGVGTNRLNIYTIQKSTEGYARWIETQGKDARDRGIMIAYDNRHMSKEFALVSAQVLAKHHIHSYIFDTLKPTPELSFGIREMNAFGGIVITASHNPPQYNGYKIYDETGCQCVLRYTNQIIDHINSVTDELLIERGNFKECQKYIHTVPEYVDENYYKSILNIQLHPELSKDDLKIVFSPQHGAANIPVREVLKRAQYNVIPVESQCNPDPNYSNTKDPNPENIVAFEEGLKIAKDKDADCIICTDPDCDRLGVMVKHNDEYIALTGNQTGVILLKYILEERTKQKTIPENPIVYTTVVSSSIGDFMCDKYGIKIEKTLTGFKFIGDKIHDIEMNKQNNFLYAYEESYGYLISDDVRDKDGVQSCLIICDAINYYKKQNKTLVDVLNEIYDEFGYFNDGQISIKMEGIDAADRMSQMIEGFRNPHMICIGNYNIIARDDYKTSTHYENGIESPISLPSSNVIKLYFEDQSWIAIRPSGTEPKLKIYYQIKDEDLLKEIKKLLYKGGKI